MTTPISGDQPLGECLRVLQCMTCRSMEELPDFHGRPEDDVTLAHLLISHGGETQNPHHGALHRVEVRVWANRNARKATIDGMWETTTGFKPAYYDVKNTLLEDAVKCHIAHHRSIPCIDWMDDSKRLKAPTGDARRSLARELGSRAFPHIDRDRLAKGAPIQHLCLYCPVSSAVEHAKRVARGEA